MIPTPYPDLNRALAELTKGAQDILRADFIGAYLQGSFAVGDFDLHSDVDFSIIVERDLTDDQVSALQALHQRIYAMNSRWAKQLEGSYFPREVFRYGTTRACDLWYLDNGSRELVRSDHCNTLVVRFVVREQGIVLAGPSPDTLIDPIDPDALRREIWDTLLIWQRILKDDAEQFNNRFYQAFIVLNHARMLHDLHRGQIGSKLAGCEWMVYHAGSQWTELIDRSWARRKSPANWIGLPADADDWIATLAFAVWVMEQARAIMTSPAV